MGEPNKNDRLLMVARAIEQPRMVAWAMALSTLGLVALAIGPTLLPDTTPLHTITIDTDPENMLETDEPVRLFHNASKTRFGLHDGVVLGVVNDTHADGVFNPATLGKVHTLTAFATTLGGVVADDVLSLSTIDSTEHRSGTVAFDWLMQDPPASAEAARAVRDRAVRIPFLRGTLFSEDEKALAIYIPLVEKSYAHDVATALQDKIDDLDAGDDDFHIAGLPVAEDTFGIEMFIQMAISAPAALIVIFLLMWAFFRRFIVIISPMLVALAAALSTMALLVISGNTIHIMSSMIPIFIMPIAVLDAVHIISDFFDRYKEGCDRKSLVTSIMRHLFTPMLFTSLTTTAGFASLALTPIPPVRAFGLFVAAGVLLAWFWTIVFVPAFLMMIPEHRLAGFGRTLTGKDDDSSSGALGWLGKFTHRRARLILVGTLVFVALAGFGISKIRVNDNPTNWFESDHRIRIADRELNNHFGGTYNAYLVLEHQPPTFSPETYATRVNQLATGRSAGVNAAFKLVLERLSSPELTAPTIDPLDRIDAIDKTIRARKAGSSDVDERAGIDVALDFLNDAFAAAEEALDDETRTPATAAQLSADAKTHVAAVTAALAQLSTHTAAVVATAPASADEMRVALAARVSDSPPVAALVASLAQIDEVFKRPDVLAHIEQLQRHLEGVAVVGKTSSLADIVKTVHRDLVSGKSDDYRLPGTAAIVAQCLDQYLSSHRKNDLWHFVTPDFQYTVVWLQLTSGDNRDMETVITAVTEFNQTAPVSLIEPQWFGLTYINVVWQEKMVSGMLYAFLGSFIIVMLMMMGLFKSILWGLLSMIPLTLTVGVIYGMTGILGKDYDMPVAVLSSLSLGLAIDYAIHFLARSRQLQAHKGSWEAARSAVFGEPARAIARNVVVVGMGFLPLLLAPLVPYQTVGIMIAAILLLAGAASLVLLPALITVLHRYLFPRSTDQESQS